METIFACLKNELVSIKNNGFKDIDGLVCSLLITLDYKVRKNTKIKNLYKKHEEDYFLRLLVNNSRYKNIIINDFTKIKKDDIYMGVIKVDIDGVKCIAFEGSNRSIIGWEENFRIGYEYPTKTQKLAIKYLDKNIDEDVILVGHSKGGNLALVGSLETIKRKYIKHIYNLDGPGFNKEVYEKASNIKDKITTYIPVNSFVGVLMKNYNTICIKSEGTGFLEHNIVNWCLNDYDFVRGELSDNSKKMHEGSIMALDTFSSKDAKIIVEKFFSLIKEKEITSKKDQEKLKAIFIELESLKISINVKKYYLKMFKMMFS